MGAILANLAEYRQNMFGRRRRLESFNKILAIASRSQYCDGNGDLNAGKCHLLQNLAWQNTGAHRKVVMDLLYCGTLAVVSAQLIVGRYVNINSVYIWGMKVLEYEVHSLRTMFV